MVKVIVVVVVVVAVVVVVVVVVVVCSKCSAFESSYDKVNDYTATLASKTA